MDWLAENIGTILVACLVLALVVVVSINYSKSDKKENGGCGYGCNNCNMKDLCDDEKKEEMLAKIEKELKEDK